MEANVFINNIANYNKNKIFVKYINYAKTNQLIPLNLKIFLVDDIITEEVTKNMKKLLSCEKNTNKTNITTILFFILLGYIIFFPAFLILCSFIGYKFEVEYPTIYSVIGVVIALSTVVFTFVFKDYTKPKITIYLCSISPIIALISTVIYTFNYPTLTAMICSLLISVCCYILLLKDTKGKKNIVITSVAFVVLFAFTFLLSGIFLVFCNFGSDTVIKTVDSPDGSRYAQIISINQGALGGNTVVDVKKYNKDIPLILFRISKKPNRVYIGEWGEFENMEIHFTSEDKLTINGKDYKIY